MGPVSAQITIDAPRERVYELLLDLSARPAFTDHLLERYHLLRIDPVGVGAGARFYLRHAGGWFDCVIEEVEPPYRILERGRGGRVNRVPCLLEWRIAELPGPSRCEVTVTFWTKPEHPVDRILELRWSQRRLAKGWREVLQRLRQLVEEERPVERLEVAGASRLGL
jgi:uncharacterized protein YndB with AHSA1/START domain